MTDYEKAELEKKKNLVRYNLRQYDKMISDVDDKLDFLLECVSDKDDRALDNIENAREVVELNKLLRSLRKARGEEAELMLCAIKAESAHDRDEELHWLNELGIKDLNAEDSE